MFATVALKNVQKPTVARKLVLTLLFLAKTTNPKNLVPTLPIFVAPLKLVDVMLTNVWLMFTFWVLLKLVEPVKPLSKQVSKTVASTLMDAKLPPCPPLQVPQDQEPQPLHSFQVQRNTVSSKTASLESTSVPFLKLPINVKLTTAVKTKR